MRLHLKVDRRRVPRVGDSLCFVANDYGALDPVPCFVGRVVSTQLVPEGDPAVEESVSVTVLLDPALLPSTSS